MASGSRTTTMTQEEQDKFLDEEIGETIKTAISADAGPAWCSVEMFLDWIRSKVKNFLFVRLNQLPVVGHWASRICVTVTEFCFTVLGTVFNLLKVLFTSPLFWKKAHETALRAWQDNTANGLMAQTYAYSKKMAGYFLEVLLQCLERAIKAHGLEMTEEEKTGINDMLDKLLPS